MTGVIPKQEPAVGAYWCPSCKRHLASPDVECSCIWASYPPAKREAEMLYRMALGDGGAEKMRELIAVPDEVQKAWDRIGDDDLHRRIQKAFRHRRQVQTYFEMLVRTKGGDENGHGAA